MKKSFLKKIQFFTMIALGTISVPMLLFVYFAESWIPYSWFFPAVYVGLGALSLMVPGKLRVGYGLVATVLLMVPGLMVPKWPMGIRETVWVVGLFYGVLLILSLQIAGWEKDREISMNVAAYCLIPHGIGQVLILFDDHRSEQMAQIGPWMTVSFIIFVGLVMLSMNRSSIAAISGVRKATAIAIRGKNTFLTLGLFGIAVLTALIPSVADDTIRLIEWVNRWIDYLMSLLHKGSELPLPTQEATAPTEELGGIQWDQILEYDSDAAQIGYIIITVLAVLVLIPLVILALIRIVNALKTGFRLLWKWMLALSANASEDYFEDEITDTRESVETEGTRKERRKGHKALFVFEQRLTPAERIRYQYRRLTEKHKDWNAASTARENLPADAAAVYERARYSDHPISDEDAVQFKAKTRKLS